MLTEKLLDQIVDGSNDIKERNYLARKKLEAEVDKLTEEMEQLQMRLLELSRKRGECNILLTAIKQNFEVKFGNTVVFSEERKFLIPSISDLLKHFDSQGLIGYANLSLAYPVKGDGKEFSKKLEFMGDNMLFHTYLPDKKWNQQLLFFKKDV